MACRVVRRHLTGESAKNMGGLVEHYPPVGAALRLRGSQIEHYVVAWLRAADEHASLSGRFNRDGTVFDIPRDERRFAGMADAGST